MLERAIALAATLHSGQTDKFGEPYILHCLRVMLRVDSDDERIVAVLHDTVEDGKATLCGLAVIVPAHLLEAIEAISRRPDERYFSYIRRLAENPLARTVKIADLDDNLDPRRGPISDSLIKRYLDARAFLASPPSSSVKNEAAVTTSISKGEA
jgi:hypothetical protein